MNSDSINLHNLNLDDDETCMICKEPLNSAAIYKLPECNHIYHTHCIITWFRCGDSRCPYCGNKGINYKGDEKSWHHRRGWRGGEESKFVELKKMGKTKNAPAILIKYLNKLKELENNLRIQKEKIKEFDIKLNTEKLIFKDAKKECQILKQTKWSIENKIFRIKRGILDLHITPLIIPVPIDINS